MSVVWIDDDDMVAGGWHIKDSKGLDDGVTQSLPLASLGLGVSVPASNTFATAPRQASITYGMYKMPDADTLRDELAILKEAVQGKFVVIRHSRRTNQQLIAYCSSFPADPVIGAQYESPFSVEVTLGFIAPDPYWYDTDAVAPTLAFSTAPTNLCQRSEDLGTSPWSASGATVTPNNALAPDGSLSADTITRVSASGDQIDQAIAFTGNGTKAVSFFIAKGTSAAVDFALFDSTASTYPHIVRCTFPGGVPTLATTTGSGTLFTAKRSKCGHWRIGFAIDSVVAAHTNILAILPSNVGANGDTAIVWGVQLENAATPSEYVRTTGAVATAVATPCGGAPVFAVVTITNDTGSTITNPHILQQTPAGATVVDLPTSCAILAGDAIEIDGLLQRARKRVSGVWSVDMTIVASGFPYPRVSNADGRYAAGLFGSIQTDKGTGSIHYARPWG